MDKPFDEEGIVSETPGYDVDLLRNNLRRAEAMLADQRKALEWCGQQLEEAQSLVRELKESRQQLRRDEEQRRLERDGYKMHAVRLGNLLSEAERQLCEPDAPVIVYGFHDLDGDYYTDTEEEARMCFSKDWPPERLRHISLWRHQVTTVIPWGPRLAANLLNRTEWSDQGEEIPL